MLNPLRVSFTVSNSVKLPVPLRVMNELAGLSLTFVLSAAIQMTESQAPCVE